MALAQTMILLIALLTPAAARSLIVESAGGVVRALDSQNKTLKEGKAGTDDAAIAQAAVDAARPGGSVLFRTGRYVFNRAVEINHSTKVGGEGRQTIIVPPERDFAFRVRRIDSSEIRRPTIHGVDWDNTLVGVTLSDLTIDGGADGRGKGIYLSHLAESTLKDLWILRTRAGAGLYLDQSVMELTVLSVHFTDNGNAAAKEASVVVSAQAGGDANNNLRFDKTFVIFPNYIGVEIGAGPANAKPPRLVFFQQCMFHGWLPIPKAAPYDLIHVKNLMPDRGMILRDSRLTNSGNKASYLSVAAGEVKVLGNSFGGGRGGSSISAASGARVLIARNTFQEIVNPEGNLAVVLDASGAEVSFKDNTLGSKSGVVRIRNPLAAVVSGNSFHNPGAGPRLVVEEGPALITANLFWGIPEEASVSAGRNAVIKDNLFLPDRSKQR